MLNKLFRYYGSKIHERDSGCCIRIFMELISGYTLHKIVIEFERLDENVMRDYTRQIVQGLQYLHEKNISHR